MRIADYKEDIDEDFDIVAIDVGSEHKRVSYLSKASDKFKVPVFAITNKMNNKLQKKCIESGANLTFEKKIFIQSLHVIGGYVKDG